MLNIGTRVAKVNIAFSTSRNAASFELEKLQCTTLSIKLYQCTLRQLKNQVFILSDVFAQKCQILNQFFKHASDFELNISQRVKFLSVLL